MGLRDSTSATFAPGFVLEGEPWKLLACFDFEENEWRIIRIMGIIPCKFPFGMNLHESSGFFLDLFVSNLLSFLPVWTCDSHAHGWLKRITNVARISARVEAVKGTSGCFLKWWYPQNTPK